MKRFNIPFSPPDMTEAEVNEVKEAILSGWITTGPRTKELERQIASYVGTERAVCLNSATACMEMAYLYATVPLRSPRSLTEGPG